MPVALSPRQVELESEKDPELSMIRHHIQTGDWSNCTMTSYLCVLGKLVLQGCRIAIPKYMQQTTLKLAHEGHQGIVKTKHRLKDKSMVERG